MGIRLLGCGLLAAVCSIPAPAEPAKTFVVEGSRALGTNQRIVSYADLEVASSSGQKVLRKRVALAIADLCDPSNFSVVEPQGSLKCSAQAWSDVGPVLARISPRLASR